MGKTAVAKREKFEMMGWLQDNEQIVRNRLPTAADEELVWFLARVGDAYRRNPALRECTKQSQQTAVLTAAKLKLDPSGLFNSAHIIPYGQDATFVPGYNGLRELALRNGEVVDADAQVVYKGDELNITLGDQHSVRHVPDLATARQDQRIIGAYCRIEMKDGRVRVEWMDRAELDRIKLRSKAKTGPWVTDFAEMCRKTPLKRGLKHVPLARKTREMIDVALEADNRAARYEAVDLPEQDFVKKLQIQPEQAEDEPPQPEDSKELPANAQEAIKFDPVVCGQVEDGAACANTIQIDGELHVRNKAKCGKAGSCPRLKEEANEPS